MAADPCRVPTPSEAANAARQLQSRGAGLTDAMFAAIGMIVAAIQALADAVYNSAMIGNVSAHAFLDSSKSVTITAGSAKEVFKNKSKDPVLLHVRAQAPIAGTGTNLLLALSQETCTHARAVRGIFSLAPEAEIVLPANATLWADIDPPASGTTSELVYSVFPLKGASGLFKAG